MYIVSTIVGNEIVSIEASTKREIAILIFTNLVEKASGHKITHEILDSGIFKTSLETIQINCIG